MAIAEYGFGFDTLDRSATGFTAFEMTGGRIIFGTGRDWFSITGDFDISESREIGEVTGNITAFSWRNIFDIRQPMGLFLEIEEADVSYQDFILGSGQDLALFFTGDDQITGSDDDDFLLSQYAAGSGNDVVHLNAGDDVADGGAGDDMLHGGAGDDILFGGSGRDTARFEGAQTNFTLTIDASSATITDRTGSQGTDELFDFEMLEFVDQGSIIPFSLEAFGGLAQLSPQELAGFVELYIAYFNRAPDAVGLAFWGTAFANGTSKSEIASLFTTQAETQAAYPDTMTNEDFATAVYDNVLGRIPDQSGFDFWVSALDSGTVGKDQFILSVLEGANMDPPASASPSFAAQVKEDQAYLAAKAQIGTYYAVDRGLSDVTTAETVMDLYQGPQSDIATILAAIDGHFDAAAQSDGGDFILQTVGVANTESAFYATEAL